MGRRRAGGLFQAERLAGDAEVGLGGRGGGVLREDADEIAEAAEDGMLGDGGPANLVADNDGGAGRGAEVGEKPVPFRDEGVVGEVEAVGNPEREAVEQNAGGRRLERVEGGGQVPGGFEHAPGRGTLGPVAADAFGHLGIGGRAVRSGDGRAAGGDENGAGAPGGGEFDGAAAFAAAHRAGEKNEGGHDGEK